MGRLRQNLRSAIGTAPLLAFLCFGGILYPTTSGSQQLHTATTRCQTVDAVVSAPVMEPIDHICRASEAAVTTLASCGLRQHGTITITVSDYASEPDRQNYGCYDQSTGIISLMRREDCRAQLAKDASRANVDADDYYRSVVVHEVTHRILLAQPGSNDLPRVAHEYIAYSLQIEALSERSKTALIAGFAGSGSRIPVIPNEILLFMNPTMFGTVSYLHFKALDDRCGTIKKVLSREIDFPSPYD